MHIYPTSMSAGDKAQLLRQCARLCRDRMREWALMWRWAPTPQLREKALEKARFERAAGEYYLLGRRKVTVTVEGMDKMDEMDGMDRKG